MIAAFKVLRHQTSVQFCCRGVTGKTATPMGEGEELMQPR